ncbi:hypothetical protein [Kushneria sinocarnis]|uniref:hypothetical protein n=1 Tax=Kushneria sinocarnis TaxID=595502 RepID=UPI0011C34F6D|nr:hypothetical protein [Kushneria sinocarnis]
MTWIIAAIAYFLLCAIVMRMQVDGGRADDLEARYADEQMVRSDGGVGMALSEAEYVGSKRAA